MSNNTNLTRDLAVKLIKSQEVVCPKCKKGILIPNNTEYKCPACGEIYRPCKLI